MSSLLLQTRAFKPVARATRSSGRGRQRMVVRASEKFCRDVVSVPSAPFQSKGEVFKVTFVGGDGDARVVDCPDDMYILEAAERAGLDLPATCKAGICGACVGRVVSGAIDQSDVEDLSFTLSDEEVEQGMVLICMARAKGDVSIETQSDWGYSLGVAEWQGATGQFSAAPDPLMGDKWSEMQKAEK